MFEDADLAAGMVIIIGHILVIDGRCSDLIEEIGIIGILQKYTNCRAVPEAPALSVGPERNIFFLTNLSLL